MYLKTDFPCILYLYHIFINCSTSIFMPIYDLSSLMRLVVQFEICKVKVELDLGRTSHFTIDKRFSWVLCGN